MPPRGHNALEGMGELLLSLVWDHCDSQEWASWLKIILLGAARGGDAEMVSALITAGAASSNLRSGDSTTPLHEAAQRGSLDVVSSLLKTSAIRDVNKKLPSSGRTPVFVAVQHGHADVAFALARAGGDVNRANDYGWSPLICAACKGRVELVIDLLLWGAQVDAKDKDGDQALHVAVRRGHLGVVKVLLRARACPGARGEHLRSSLDWAAQDGDTDTLRELLASVPDLNILDGGGSAMYVAVEYGQHKAIDMLVDAGVNVDSPLIDGNMPLHAACLDLQPSSVQALLRRNADETVRNGGNELPGEIVGHGIPKEERDHAVIEDIREGLAPAGLAGDVESEKGCNRQRAHPETPPTAVPIPLDQQCGREDHEDGAGNDQHHGAEPPSVLRSRRKLADGRKWTTGDAVHVHPTRKKLHWIVTKMVHVADGLVFRNIVSYL